jgi:DNA modification methylase
MSDQLKFQIIQGNCLNSLKSLPDKLVQTVVTSPPYYGLRNYRLPPTKWSDGWLGCLGLEPSPDIYVRHLTEVFHEIKRVIRDDGVIWVNLGTSYSSAKIESEEMVLREDLSKDEICYVLSELSKHEP